MKFSLSRSCVCAGALSAGCALLIAALPLVVLAASPSSKPTRAVKPTGTVIGLFEGMESGEIEVKVIPKDSTEGTVTIKNKSGKPLTIKLPEALAAVPVHAQFGGGGMMGGGGGMMGGGGGMMGGGGMNQGMGGGMMGGGMGMGGGGMMGGGGGGFFNVAPDKVVKGKITAVCLDHGKKDPNPRVPYKLIPVESYAKNAEVAEVLKMLVRGEIDQHSAQAAAWHLQNGLSWEELAKKIGAKHLNGSVEPYFTTEQLQRAFTATRVAEERAEKASKENPESSSIGEKLASQN
jgi:hypothetical protein